MAPDLGFVANAAQAHPRKLTPERIGNGLAQAGFAYSGRAEETEDRPATVGVELAHGQVLDQAAFDFLEIVVIAVKDFLGLAQIEVVRGGGGPWQVPRVFQRNSQ